MNRQSDKVKFRPLRIFMGGFCSGLVLLGAPICLIVPAVVRGFRYWWSEIQYYWLVGIARNRWFKPAKPDATAQNNTKP